jgi:hypothetical protein
MLAVKVVNFRRGPYGAIQAFFDVEIGLEDNGDFQPAFQLRGYALLAKNAGGYWVRPAGKPRLKDGEPVTDDKGFKVYDNHYDVALEQGRGGAWGPSKLGRKLKDAIVAQATALLEEGAAPKPKAAASRGGAVSTTGGKARGTPLPPADEDDLPF